MRILLAALLFGSAAMAQPHGPPPGAMGHGPHMNEADEKALSSYDLTSDHVKKTLAVGDKLRAMPPEKRPPMRPQGQAHGLDDAAKMMEQNPDFSKLLKSEGISARDFLLTSIAMSQAVMVNAMRERHPDMQQTPPGVNPKNLEWAQKHASESQAWRDAMQKMGRERGMHGPPGGPQGGPPGNEEGPAK